MIILLPLLILFSPNINTFLTVIIIDTNTIIYIINITILLLLKCFIPLTLYIIIIMIIILIHYFLLLPKLLLLFMLILSPPLLLITYTNQCPLCLLLCNYLQTKYCIVFTWVLLLIKRLLLIVLCCCC